MTDHMPLYLSKADFLRRSQRDSTVTDDLPLPHVSIHDEANLPEPGSLDHPVIAALNGYGGGYIGDPKVNDSLLYDLYVELERLSGALVGFTKTDQQAFAAYGAHLRSPGKLVMPGSIYFSYGGAVLKGPKPKTQFQELLELTRKVHRDTLTPAKAIARALKVTIISARLFVWYYPAVPDIPDIEPPMLITKHPDQGSFHISRSATVHGLRFYINGSQTPTEIRSEDHFPTVFFRSSLEHDRRGIPGIGPCCAATLFVTTKMPQG